MHINTYIKRQISAYGLKRTINYLFIDILTKFKLKCKRKLHFTKTNEIQTIDKKV